MESVEPPRRYAVVGGGVSGIAVAHYLRERGHEAEILERDVQIGGRSQSAQLAGREVTLGGKNIGRRYDLFRAFARSLGDHPLEPFGINASPVRGDRLRTFESEHKIRGVARFVSDTRPRDALRFVRLAAAVRGNDDNRFLGSPYFTALAARRDHRPLSAYFSGRFAGNVIRAMTVRMNGAEPDEVFLGNFGTNLGMLLDSYDQLTHGMGALVSDFTRRHVVRTGVHVKSLVVEGGAVRGVRAATDDGGDEVWRYDGVVLAVPAVAASPLVADVHPLLATTLAGVRYFPTAVVIARYSQPVFSERVRGVVFPAGEPVSNAGAYGVSDLDIVRYTFSGRAARERLAAGADPESLLELAESKLARFLPVRAARRTDFVFRRWSTGYCAYVPDHGSFLTQVREALDGIDGLHLTGDYLRGASIEACFRAARDCADRAASADGASPRATKAGIVGAA